MGEGTGSPKTGQGEIYFPNSSPAAGTMAERAPGEKQTTEAEERKPWESTWGSTGVRGEDPAGKWRGQKGNRGRDENIANNRATVVKEGWMWQKHFSLLIQLKAFRDLPYADRTGHGARTGTEGLVLQTCQHPHWERWLAAARRLGASTTRSCCAGLHFTLTPSQLQRRCDAQHLCHRDRCFLMILLCFLQFWKGSVVDLLGYSWKSYMQL